MKDRLKELAEEAGWMEIHADSDGPYDYFDHVHFAQLVAAECVKLIEEGMDYESGGNADHSAGELAGLRWARQVIQEKFKDLK